MATQIETLEHQQGPLVALGEVRLGAEGEGSGGHDMNLLRVAVRLGVVATPAGLSGCPKFGRSR